MVQENRLYLVDTGVIGQNVWPHEHGLTKSISYEALSYNCVEAIYFGNFR